MKYVLLSLTLAVTLAFTGCDFDEKLTGFLYEESGGSYVVTDQFGNSLEFDKNQAEYLVDLDAEVAQEFLNLRFEAAYPDSYSEGADVDVVATEEVAGDLEVSGTASSALNALKLVPYGDVASYALNGLLGIGAVWLGKRKSTAQKVNKSLVQGIDVFRDILDQTDVGDKIDSALIEALKERQGALNTGNEVNKLLQRYATPTKKPIDL